MEEEPTRISHEAEAQRQASRQRMIKWHDTGSVWPPAPAGQKILKPVKQPPSVIQQVFVCSFQFISGLIISYVVVSACYGLLSSFLPRHVPSYKPQTREMPGEIGLAIATAAVVVALAGCFFRKSGAFAAGLTVGGLFLVLLSLTFLGA